MNNIVNGKKCTIIWNVDDLNMSHLDSDTVSSVLADIDAEYGNIAKMTRTRGKIHKYLGMTIYHSLPWKVIFSMFNYIGTIIYDIPEGIRG